MACQTVILMCNKIDDASKQGGANFVKLFARWSNEAKRVRLTSVGIEGVGNTT